MKAEETTEKYKVHSGLEDKEMIPTEALTVSVVVANIKDAF